MVAPIVLVLLFLIALSLTWVLTLAETALDYLSFRDAEAIVAQHPTNPIVHIMERLAEHQLATRFWNTVFLASSAVLITVFIDHFVSDAWLAASGGRSVMAGLALCRCSWCS